MYAIAFASAVLQAFGSPPPQYSRLYGPSTSPILNTDRRSFEKIPVQAPEKEGA